MTPEKTTSVVLALRERRDASGETWALIRLPILPNGATGWVPRAALGAFHAVRTHLVVDTHALTASLYRSDRLVFRAPVGIGRPRWPTPTRRMPVGTTVTIR